MPNDENRKKLSQLAERAWADENLRKKLLSDPTPLFQKDGIEIPEGLGVQVLADENSVSFNFIPQAQANGELSESTLNNMVGGVGYLVFTFKLVAVKTVST